MFTIVAKPRAWWPVSFPGVTEEGEIITNTFEMQFFLLKVDDLQAFQLKQQEMSAEIEKRLQEEGGEVTASVISAELVKLIAGNWRGVAVEGAGEVPWNDENLRQLVNVPNVLDAVLSAWHDCMAARQKVHEGN